MLALPYVLPFALFMGFLALRDALRWVADTMIGETAPWWLSQPEHWIYPVQTLVCGVAVVWFWRRYSFGGLARWPLAVAAGLLIFVLWIAPQEWFGQPPRLDGFDPAAVATTPLLQGLGVVARMLRLVVVVAFVEEIFWRGFLQRYLVRERFTEVPFGTYTLRSLGAVAVLFMLIHSVADYPAALATGLIIGGVACVTRSLGSCILAHAVANLGLGIYILVTRQWGFW